MAYDPVIVATAIEIGLVGALLALFAGACVSKIVGKWRRDMS
jgi:hypothetical protein